MTAEPEVVASSNAARRASIVVAAGVFASSLANSQVLALPFRVALKDGLHAGPAVMATFLTLAMLPWHAKSLVGWISDRRPLGGERRRPYFVVAAGLAAIGWAAIALAPLRFGPLLASLITANLGAVVASVVSGALLVEIGQRFARTQRLSQIRTLAAYGAVIPGSLLSGWLADRPLGFTAAVAGTVMVGAGLLAAMLLSPRPQRENGAIAAAETVPTAPETSRAALLRLLRARGLWLVTAFVFLLQLAPGFQSPLFFVQTEKLGFAPSYIGLLYAFASAAAVIVSLGYHRLVGGASLRRQLQATVGLYVIGALAYLGYRSRGAAIPIEMLGAIASAFGQISLFALAARVAPTGLEGVAYALVASLYGIATHLSDVLGSLLYEDLHVGFSTLVCVNACASLLALVLMPLLPPHLLAAENRAPAETSTSEERAS